MRFKLLVLALTMNFLPFADSHPAQADFTKLVIDTDFPGASRPVDVRVADLNGDNELDLVVTAPDPGGGDDVLLSYENDGSESFTRNIIDATTNDLFRVAVADLDADFDNDIVLTAFASGEVAWFGNSGDGSFEKNLIDRLAGARIPFVVDLEDDADRDVVVLANVGIYGEINDGSQSFTRDTVESENVVDLALFVTDLDGDSDNDVVTAIFTDGEHHLIWYGNNGSGNFSRNTIDVTLNDITDLVVDDLDEDGDKDIITVEFQNSIHWYRNDGNESFTKESISTDFRQAPRSVSSADIDNDGDKDVIVTGGNSARGEVVYYENDGGENFIKRTIDSTAGNRRRLFVSDVDRDGDLDVFVTNQFPSELIYYRNEMIPAG